MLVKHGFFFYILIIRFFEIYNLYSTIVITMVFSLDVIVYKCNQLFYQILY